MFALAGDSSTARIGFLLAVTCNVPVALAGRVAVSGIPGLIPSLKGELAEWVRPVAAWGYGLLLASLLPYLDTSLWTAAILAAGASAAAGALMYVAPGTSTPAGLRLHRRQRSGTAWRHEGVVFVATRAARLLIPTGGGSLLFGHPGPAVLCLWAAAGAELVAASLRPRNAAASDQSTRTKERMR